MPPDLPETYYLDNVIVLFDHIESLYGDILEQEQLKFLHQFAYLTIDAKKLYIRLLNRSHQLFRLSKVDYSEIGPLERAIQELETCRFLQVDPEIERQARLALFSKRELLALHPEPKILRTLNRMALESQLLEQSDGSFFAAVKQSDRLIQVLQKDSYLLFQMLFFGNLN